MTPLDDDRNKYPGRRALVVDDHSKTAELIKAELEKKGMEVMTAISADEATKLIINPETRPELVFLDVNMPNINGAQLCRFIKGNETFSHIKVVFCSSIDSAELAKLAKECGADGCVHKESIFGPDGLKKLLGESA